MPRIQLKNIAKRWVASTAVEPVSLDIADGEFLVLLRPSGCGDATMVTIQQGDLMITAKAGKDYRSAIGVRVGLHALAERCHLFDAGTQARIALLAGA